MRKQIDNNFRYHAPKPVTIPMLGEIRGAAKSFAELINDICPDSREKSIAITKIEEAVMWANAAVARNQDDIKEET